MIGFAWKIRSLVMAKQQRATSIFHWNNSRVLMMIRQCQQRNAHQDKKCLFYHTSSSRNQSFQNNNNMKRNWNNFKDSIQDYWRDGTLEIGIGITIFSLLVIDYTLQTFQQWDRRRMLKMLSIHNQQQQQQQQHDEDYNDLDSLFQCRVCKVASHLDGTKMLTGVVLGDVVQVLQEGVGPGGMYNLCRHGTAIGWFPQPFLEKIK